jgi:hypothetical protein
MYSNRQCQFLLGNWTLDTPATLRCGIWFARWFAHVQAASARETDNKIM